MMKQQTWKLFSNKKFVNAVLATSIVAVAFAAPTPFDQKAEAASTQLKNQAQGSAIKFAGYEWIVLEPSTGYVLMKDNLEMKAFDPNGTNVFNPSDSNNIGHYLNSTWFATLPEDQRAWIQVKSWSIGNENNESASSVSAKVGLISYSEWNSYKGVLGNPSKYFWTRSPSSSFANRAWVVHMNGELISHFGNITGSVRPALSLDSGYLMAQLWALFDLHLHQM